MEVCGEEEIWRCRTHPSRRPSGVCAACLRDRLLRLCPDCAAERPCACCPPSSSNSSSSSSSGDLARSASRVGSVGRVSQLIDREPAFCRSQSTALPFIRPRSDVPVEARPRGLAKLWPFARPSAAREEERAAAAAEMSRSRSVGVEMYTDLRGGGAAAAARDSRLKGWVWRFPSPLKAFRQRKAAKIVVERATVCQD